MTLVRLERDEIYGASFLHILFWLDDRGTNVRIMVSSGTGFARIIEK